MDETYIKVRFLVYLPALLFQCLSSGPVLPLGGQIKVNSKHYQWKNFTKG